MHVSFFHLGVESPSYFLRCTRDGSSVVDDEINFLTFYIKIVKLYNGKKREKNDIY